MQAVGGGRKVDLVGSRAIVIGSPAANREAQGHRLKRARFIAGQLQAFDMRGKVSRFTANLEGRSACSLRKESAEPFSATDLFQQRQQQLRIAEAEPRLRKQAFFRTLHGEGDGRARRDRVQPELVAHLGRTKHHVWIADAAERAESEKALVLQTYFFRLPFRSLPRRAGGVSPLIRGLTPPARRKERLE